MDETPHVRARQSDEGDLDDRGQSELLGLVLLTGIVIGTAVLLAVAGGGILSAFMEQSADESTTNAIEELDTRLSSVSSVSGRTQVEFSTGSVDPSRFRIVRSGYIDVTSNRNASCSAHIPLSSVRLRSDGGLQYVYEAGGIWLVDLDDNVSTMHTPPDLTFNRGTLSLTVLNLTGRIDESRGLLGENTTASRLTTTRIRETLFRGSCTRPNNVTISVHSDAYKSWSSYLRGEIDATSFDVFHGNDTVEVFLDQDKLPEVTDDAKNNVVDLTDDSFNNVDVTNSSIRVNKSANNTYTTIVTPLSTGGIQVGEIRTVDSDTFRRPPMDVVFVVDESGSMGDDSKMSNAKEAARAFVAEMNGSHDRAAVVGFDVVGYIYNTSDGEYMTNDFDASGVNGSIEDLSPGGGTDIAEGLDEGNVLHGLLSNSSRTKVVVLLGDGQNNDPDDPECDDGWGNEKACLDQKAFEMAEQADKNDVTIHAVGFGDPDNATMETIANTTGGSYRYVDDSDDLSDVFVDLFTEISQSRQIVRDPFSMTLAAGGTTYFPQMNGNTTHVAKTDNGSLNLNDPLAPSSFSYSIDVSDGDNITMTAYDYSCDTWKMTEIVRKNESTGKQYAEVRCSDINESSSQEIEPKNMTVYLDGDDVSSLLSEPIDWWQEDLQNETLAPYLADNGTTLDLRSNAAIAVFRFPDGDDSVDRMLVHFRIGSSREDTVPTYLFNVAVRHVHIGSG